MYHKVFINNVEVIFSNKPQKGVQSVPQLHNIGELYTWLESDERKENEVCVIDQFNQLWQQFKDYHKLIEAAGGLVENELGELLVIKRLGFWDLPKGKLEEGEQSEKGAMREVEEECAISNLEIVSVLPSTYHTYVLNGKPILKKTYWYKMSCSGSQQLIPQTEEDITEVKFMNKNEVNEVLNTTYASLVPLFYTYLFGNE